MTLAARWVHGLTLALGLTAAAAIALADPASAAPTGSSAESSSHRPEVGRRHSEARQVSPKPTVTRSAGSTPLGRAPLGRAPEVRVAPTAFARTYRRVIQTAVAAPAVAADAATTSATAASKPYPRWDSRGRLITIYKGTHFVIPNRWALWVTKDSGEATFTADSAYDLGDEDQFDWNKLAGITFTPWRPDRNSSMIVWRYNLQSGMYEIGPFFNVDFRYVFPTDDEVITVPADQTFSYSVDYNGITVSYGDRTVYKSTPDDLVPNFWTSARVTGWFGGSEVAPRTVSYYQNLT